MTVCAANETLVTGGHDRLLILNKCRGWRAEGT